MPKLTNRLPKHTDQTTSDAEATRFIANLVRHALIRTDLCNLLDGTDGYTLKPRTINDYNFIYVTHGSLVWEVAGTAHHLQPCQFAFVPPGVVHRGWSTTNTFTFASIHVEARLGGHDLFEQLGLDVWHETSAGSRLDNYFRGAMGEFTRTDAADRTMMLSSWGRLIVLETLREAQAARRLHFRCLDPVVGMMLVEIERVLSKPVTLDVLAQMAGYSPQHLNRTFRKVLGVTAIQYLTQRRIERATEMLRENTLAIKAIAGAVGVEDAAYFSRLFRQWVGASPAEYRQMQRSENPSCCSGTQMLFVLRSLQCQP